MLSVKLFHIDWIAYSPEVATVGSCYGFCHVWEVSTKEASLCVAVF